MLVYTKHYLHSLRQPTRCYFWERRLRACKLLGKSTIEGKYVVGDLRTLALVENIFRSDLTAVELSESVAALQDQKQCKADEIARIIRKAKSTTSEILSLVNLTEKIRQDARNRPEMTRERLLKFNWKCMISCATN